MRRVCRILAVLSLVVLLGSFMLVLIPAPALAQEGGGEGDIPIDIPDEYSTDDGSGSGSDSEDDTDADTGGSEDDDEDESGATDQIGVGDAVGGGMGGSAGDLLDGVAEWFVEASLNFIQWMLTGTLEIVIGTPTPENAGWLGIFGSPTNAPFADLYADLYEALIFPLTLSFFALAILINASLMPFSSILSKYHMSKWVTLSFVAVIAIALSWPLMTAMHALSDAVGTTIAPSATELTETEQGIETALTGLGTTGAAIYLTSGINLLIYGLIYGMRYFLLMMVMPYVFGLALATSIFAPSERIRSFGSGIIGLHIGLLVMSWPMAMLFRAAYIIGWDFGLSGLANVLLMVGALVSGVGIPIMIAYQMTRLTVAMRANVRGTGRYLSSRESHTPASAKYAKRGGVRARDIGRSAYHRAPTAAQAVRARIPMMGGNTAHESWGSSSRRMSGRSARTDGGTQAARKKSAATGRMPRQGNK